MKLKKQIVPQSSEKIHSDEEYFAWLKKMDIKYDPYTSKKPDKYPVYANLNIEYFYSDRFHLFAGE